MVGIKHPKYNVPRYKGTKLPRDLKPRQIKAINAYMTNGNNKAEAMRTAGYSESTATNAQSLVFDHPNVVKEIRRRVGLMTKRAMLSEDWILERLMMVADAPRILAEYKKVSTDGSLYWDFTGASEQELAVVTELGVDFYTVGGTITVKKFKVKAGDSHAALIALARHMGMFKDKLEITGSLAEKLQAGRARAFGATDEDGDDQETIH